MGRERGGRGGEGEGERDGRGGEGKEGEGPTFSLVYATPLSHITTTIFNYIGLSTVIRYSDRSLASVNRQVSSLIISQPSIYIDGWLYGMRMTSVVCNVPVLSQNDSTYHHSVFTT